MEGLYSRKSQKDEAVLISPARPGQITLCPYSYAQLCLLAVMSKIYLFSLLWCVTLKNTKTKQPQSLLSYRAPPGLAK